MLTIALLLASDELMPLEVGTEWHFSGRFTAQQVEHDREFVIRVVEGEGGETIIEGALYGLWGYGEVLQIRQQRDVEVSDIVRSDDNGIEIVGTCTDGLRDDQAGSWVWLVADHAGTPRWEAHPMVGSVDMMIHYGLHEEEQVTVPAGTFATRPLGVDMMGDDLNRGDVSFRGRMWLAPGVGPVRLRWSQGSSSCEAELLRVVRPEE